MTDLISALIQVLSSQGINLTITSNALTGKLSFVNTSTLSPNGYLWNFGDNSTLVQQSSIVVAHTYNLAGSYPVTLIAYGIKGCNDTLTSSVLIVDTTGLTMPNVFTPNGDGINDYFAPNAHGMKTLSCNIYDRWGIKIVTIDGNNIAYWD